jgi:hypothetical protein
MRRARESGERVRLDQRLRRRCPLPGYDLIVAAANEWRFRRLCEVLDPPEVADDPRFTGTEGSTGGFAMATS